MNYENKNLMKIEDFIKKFNEKYDWSQYFFLNWWCKIFANIISEIYWWETLDYLWHYVSRIWNDFYDITWKLEWISIEKCNKEWDCKANDEMMNSYMNIYYLLS